MGLKEIVDQKMQAMRQHYAETGEWLFNVPILSERKTKKVARPKPINIPPDALAKCAECPDQKGCPNVTVCCGEKVSINITVPCKLNKWKFIEDPPKPPTPEDSETLY